MTLHLDRDTDQTSQELAKAPARKPFWKRPWIIPLAVLVVYYIYTQASPYVGVPEDQAPLQPHQGFPAYYPLLFVHIGAGTVAMLTMILQVWPWLRQHHPRIHRWSGRSYVFASVVGSCVALTIVWYAPKPGKVGALCLAIAWLVTTVAGYRAARRRDFEKHRRFMLYSFGIAANNMWAAYAAMIIQDFNIPIDVAYYQEAARWIPWVGNLMLVQWWLYRTARRRKAQAVAPLAAIESGTVVNPEQKAA
ncbi:MAG TPA: DUF2306 domain-containing protein [Pseudonocardiaceae bacterium]|nr:DUF2306 domain-containing protein [Pseudonocardiaceae bacterium]